MQNDFCQAADLAEAKSLQAADSSSSPTLQVERNTLKLNRQAPLSLAQGEVESISAFILSAVDAVDTEEEH